MNLDKRSRLALLVLILVVLLAGTYNVARLMFGRRTDISLLAKQVDSIVSANIASINENPSDIRKNFVTKKRGRQSWEQIETVIILHESEPLNALSHRLQAGLNLSNLEIKEEDGKGAPSPDEQQFSVYFDDLPIYQVLLKREPAPPPLEEDLLERNVPVEPKMEQPIPVQNRPKIALIVDDVGYEVERALEVLRLGCPITLSILPHLDYSSHIAEVAQNMGYEVMLHLPMESRENLRRSPGFVTSKMSAKEISWVLDRDFESVPAVVGVNNHQGSKMTGDAKAMERVMRYLRNKNVFFIDSRTTKESVAYETARAFGLRAAENDMFLDNEKDVEYIKGRISLLIEDAWQKGKVIGICHVHPATIQALREMLPLIEVSGVDLVFASQVVE